MSTRNIAVGVGVLILIPVALAAWWFLSPLFIDKTVDEEFPFAANAEVPPNMTMEEVEQVMAGLAKVDMTVADEPMPPEMAEMAGPASPLLLQSGQFKDADSFHRGSGLAAIFQGPDGSHLLRLEDFQVTNGPALHVILTPHPSPQTQEHVKTPGYVDLGNLKGNQGNQNYPIPEGVDVGSQASVVIYCMPFHVIFSTASLAPAS